LPKEHVILAIVMKKESVLKKTNSRPWNVKPDNRYENEACSEQAKDGNMTGQFDLVGEISGEKKDELNQVEFVPPQGLILDAASSKIEKWSMENGEERKKGPKKYTSWEVLSRKPCPSKNKEKTKWDESQPIKKNRVKRSTLYIPQWNETLVYDPGERRHN
ncbi:1415_t:CDS:2, partial [Cetraspora pellucida]